MELISKLLFLLVVAFSAVSCRKHASESLAKPEENALVQEKERGPVKVILRLEPREPSFADRLKYTITARAEKGVEVTLPAPGENLGAFIIKDYLPFPSASAPDGRTETVQSYILEVLTSGDYTIPETTISFADKREDGAGNGAGGAGAKKPAENPPVPEAKVYKLVTDPITIKVKSLEGTEKLEDLKPIAGPVEPPAIPLSLKWPLLAAGGLLGLAGLAVLVIYWLRRPAPAPPPVPPEERAYRELEWLLGQRYAEQGELKEFFFHLSRIVREYIERRFGLRAPERTTEEFLEELSRSDLLDAQFQRLLKRFLERADLVKFALYAPAPEEIEASFAAAKEFIAATRKSAEGPAGGQPEKPREVASGVR